MGICRNPSNGRVRAALALLLMLAAAPIVHAQAVYKCRDAQGHVAYQDRVCPGAATQTQVALAPEPKPVASPQYSTSTSVQSGGRGRAKNAAPASRRARTAEAMSYECRAGNGEVFYRHGTCPKSITAGASAVSGGKRRGTETSSIAVSAQPMPRSEACRRMRGSPGRGGQARDDAVSTYERNLGRDPCR